jgi:hypothetical protein
MNTVQGITAHELLERTYVQLVQITGGETISLPRTAHAEIADDSDYHRTRIGYATYKSAVVVEIAGKPRVLAFGGTGGSYPSDPYDCDIAAPTFTEENSEMDQAMQAYAALESNLYYRYSLIHAMSDGQLAVSGRSKLGRAVIQSIGPKLHEFVAKDLEVDPNLFMMDLRPVVRSGVLYKPELVELLARTLHEVLLEAT